MTSVEKGMIVSIAMEAAFDGSANYAGGLGVLEADKFYGAGKIGLPYILIVPFYPNGYVDWDIANRAKYVEVKHRHTLSFLSKLRYIESMDVRNRKGKLIAEVDLYEYSFGSAKAILYRVKRPLYTARLFRYLYRHHSDECTYYITAAAVSSKIIEKISSTTPISYIDVQEAHLALVPYLLPDNMNVRFVTHTPGPWGHPKLCKEAEEILDISLPNVKTMTEAAMEKVSQIFTVSRKHLEVTKNTFPRYASKMSYVTNGIYLDRWQRIEGDVNLNKFIEYRNNLKKEFISIIKVLSGKNVGDRMILAWIRRITKYKRPYFIEWLIEENSDLKDRVFIVVSGKPHPGDEWGKELAATFVKFSKALSNFFFYPSYGIEFAYYSLSGSDLLLFTPLSCWEASGTSMMKAGVNGVPTLSSRDGASLELIEDNFNGWFFGEELREIIDINSDEAAKIDERDYNDFIRRLTYIIDLYSEDRDRYMEISYNVYKTFTPIVDIKRVLRQYYPIYFPSQSS